MIRMALEPLVGQRLYPPREVVTVSEATDDADGFESGRESLLSSGHQRQQSATLI